MTRRAVAAVALGACVAAVWQTASPEPLPDKLLACGELSDPGERVRCYDTQIAAITGTAPAPPDQPLLATITSLHTIGQKTLVTLSNGQTWREEDSRLTALSRAGDDVRIEKGALGAYHMSIVAQGAKNWVLVTRVK